MRSPRPAAARVRSIGSLAAAALGVSVVLSACPSPRSGDPSSRPVLAKVNDEVLTVEEFGLLYNQQRLELDDAIGPVASARELQKETLLNNLIDELLLEQEAQRMHIVVSNEEVERELEQMRESWDPGELDQLMAEKGLARDDLLRWTRRRLVVAKYLTREVYARVAVTDAEITALYEQDPERWLQPEQVHARHILVKTEAQAHEVLSAIRAGADFEELALRYSLSPDAHRGGDLGFFARERMPKVFDEACFKLQTGQLSPVVPSEYGFHVFQLLERRAPRQRQLAEVADEIERELRLTRERQVHLDALARLRQGARIEVHRAALARLE